MIVLLGANGQVGRAVVEAATARGIAVRGLSRDECDIADPIAVEAALAGARLVVNAAAYTAVDRAETDVEAAFRANAEAPGIIARACAARGIALIHLSTDYVFDGDRDGAWREDDATGPLGVYGRSKLAGEGAVRDALAQHIVLRTSWVFSEHGSNFVRTMRRLGETGPLLRVVDDQHGGPTAASAVADALLRIAAAISQRSDRWGTYHFSGTPATTWRHFAVAILADKPGVEVEPIPTSAYPTPAVRPRNAVLDCSRIAAAFGIAQPDWRTDLAKVLERLG